MANIFTPQEPDRVKGFMDSVQPASPAIYSQMTDTASQVTKALGSTIGFVGTAPLALAESGLYLSANTMAFPSVFLNKAGGYISKARASIFKTLSGSNS